jgi:hypothetical protein
MMSDEPLGCCLALFVAGLPGVGLILSTMAALLLGVLAPVLLIRLGRSGGIDSPRCGTFNERHSAACSVCSRWRRDDCLASRCLGARQLLDHALAGPLPLLQEDQEIGHLLPVRPLVELPDEVGADIAGGGQDPKEIPPRRWSERVSEASRILPKHRGASVSVAWP